MRPYVPDNLPLETIRYGRKLTNLVGEANAELARFDGMLKGITHADLLLSPLTKEEAVRSSRIEGTQATLDDVLEFEAGMEKPLLISEDIQEILNYREAALYGAKYSDEYLSLHFIRSLHQVLMKGVRGADKQPGMFRTKQNYIGSPNSTIDEASFIPPDPIKLMEYLEAFEQYLRYDGEDPLVQSAIIHAQFELLHPFNDGNGRIGRLLIPLVLFRKGRLSQPVFYISSYLEKNREGYYHSLRGISSNEKDWNGWIEFFLKAVAIEARRNSRRVQSIRELYDEMKISVLESTGSKYAMIILDALFDKPKFQVASFIQQIIKQVDISQNVVRDALNLLKDEGILQELTPARGRRSAVLGFGKLLNITGTWEELIE